MFCSLAQKYVFPPLWSLQLSDLTCVTPMTPSHMHSVSHTHLLPHTLTHAHTTSTYPLALKHSQQLKNGLNNWTFMYSFIMAVVSILSLLPIFYYSSKKNPARAIVASGSYSYVQLLTGLLCQSFATYSQVDSLPFPSSAQVMVTLCLLFWDLNL